MNRRGAKGKLLTVNGSIVNFANCFSWKGEGFYFRLEK